MGKKPSVMKDNAYARLLYMISTCAESEREYYVKMLQDIIAERGDSERVELKVGENE